MRFGLPRQRAVLAITLVVSSVLSPAHALAQSPLGQSASQNAARVAPVNHAQATLEAKLTLRVYNYARLDSMSLTLSEKIAAAIFQNVGIETVWVDCPVSKEKSSAYLDCQSDMGTSDLVLRILPRRMALKLLHRHDTLGFAQICPETEPACELNVFYHQIDELAARGYRGDRILGYAMAHEMAHVLIGPAHSEEGIMRGEWTPTDLQRISLGLSLDFSNSQSSQLRNAVFRRTTTPVLQEFAQAKQQTRCQP
jgi:hypothetical protein